MRQITMHAMDNKDAATISISSSHVLPVEDLREMLMHIEAEIPLTMHLPVSLDDTLHFYRYLCTYVLVAEEQFLLLTDVHIQDHTQQLNIYQVFKLLIPWGNLPAWYNIDTKYLGISYDETNATEILEQQFTICQWANGEFCKINAPLQPLSNPPSCITAIYAKNKAWIECWCSLQIRNTYSTTIPTQIASNLWILTLATRLDHAGVTLICLDQVPKSIKIHQPLQVLHLPLACSATSQHLHLPPHYKNHQMTINTSLNTANLNAVNISSPEFWVWQHLEDHWNKTQLHELADVPTAPVAHLYMIDNNIPILPFNLTDESINDKGSIWTLFSHTGIYIMAIGLLMAAGLGIFCCYFMWCWPAILVCQPFQSGSLWHTIVDNDVEAASIYRGNGKNGQPVIRPCENHDLHMKQELTWMEVNRSNKHHQKQSLHPDHWIQYPKSRQCNEHTWFVVRLRIGPVTASLKERTDLQLKENSHLIPWSKHVHSRNKRFSTLKKCMHSRHVLPHQRIHTNGLD